MNIIKPTREQLLEIYDLVFHYTHSPGFKIAEINNLLFENDYWFLEPPVKSWKTDLMTYLDKIGYDKSNLNMNPKF